MRGEAMEVAKSVFSKVMRVGRATVSCFGLAVTLALMLGMASAAFGANGDNFVLGQANLATAITRLAGAAGVNGPMLRIDNNNPGANATALDLQVEPGRPPVRVNSDAKVADLNADELDGQDSGDFLASGAAAGGDLTGSYPSPEIEGDVVGSNEVDDRSLRLTDYAVSHASTGTFNFALSTGLSQGRCVDQIFGAGAATNGDVVLYFPADTSQMPTGLILQPTGVATTTGTTYSQARMRICNVGPSIVAAGSEFPVKFVTLR